MSNGGKNEGNWFLSLFFSKFKLCLGADSAGRGSANQQDYMGSDDIRNPPETQFGFQTTPSYALKKRTNEKAHAILAAPTMRCDSL